MPKLDTFMTTESSSGKELSMGVDDDGHLYVNGKAVVTKQKVELQLWVNIFVVFGAVGSLAQGIVAILNYLK